MEAANRTRLIKIRIFMEMFIGVLFDFFITKIYLFIYLTWTEVASQFSCVLVLIISSVLMNMVEG
jgi:hypothetical protein